MENNYFLKEEQNKSHLEVGFVTLFARSSIFLSNEHNKLRITIYRTEAIYILFIPLASTNYLICVITK